jgi:hypothetical protein
MAGRPAVALVMPGTGSALVWALRSGLPFARSVPCRAAEFRGSTGIPWLALLICR